MRCLKALHARLLRMRAREYTDAIILDNMMPKIDGFAMLREVRADERTSTKPVIIFSARTEQDARAEGVRAGANVFISKPLPIPRLVEELCRQLQQRGTNQHD